MSSEALLSSIIPFAGSGLLGYAMGFALRSEVNANCLGCSLLVFNCCKSTVT